MTLADIRIAIPSHNRPEVLVKKTLTMLEQAKNPWPVDVFLSSQEQGAAYRAVQDVNVLIAPSNSLLEKCNIIEQHYPYGTPVVFIEDDISALVMKDGNKVRVANEEFVTMVKEGFREAVKAGTAIWGINPTANGLYMNQANSTSLKLIVAYLFGFITHPYTGLRVTVPCKMDYERSLLYHRTFGSVVRMNRYAVRTAPYTTPGGLQSMADRAEQEEASVKSLIRRFPKNVVRNTKREGPFPEILIKR